mmetsp:Transcript_8088/g.17086  ORF Transcript_8088/g.17086 Transcript_8088/m.17086 type:complete len:313 (-) Transcript_8088:106-1044(-)
MPTPIVVGRRTRNAAAALRQGTFAATAPRMTLGMLRCVIIIVFFDIPQRLANAFQIGIQNIPDKPHARGLVHLVGQTVLALVNFPAQRLSFPIGHRHGVLGQIQGVLVFVARVKGILVIMSEQPGAGFGGVNAKQPHVFAIAFDLIQKVHVFLQRLDAAAGKHPAVLTKNEPPFAVPFFRVRGEFEFAKGIEKQIGRFPILALFPRLLGIVQELVVGAVVFHGLGALGSAAAFFGCFGFFGRLGLFLLLFVAAAGTGRVFVGPLVLGKGSGRVGLVVNHGRLAFLLLALLFALLFRFLLGESRNGGKCVLVC